MRLWERTCNVKQFRLLNPEAPFVGTGMEYVSARDSGAAVIATHEGIVEHVEAKEIRVRRIETVDGKEVQGDLTTYRLEKFIRSNQGTCYNQRPLVSVGDRVEPKIFLQMVLQWKTENLHLDVTFLQRL